MPCSFACGEEGTVHIDVIQPLHAIEWITRSLRSISTNVDHLLQRTDSRAEKFSTMPKDTKNNVILI